MAVLRNGAWLPATIVEQVGPTQFRVRYAGYGPAWDEIVGPERIRRESEAGGSFAPNEVVLVQSDGRHWLAQIVEAVGPDRYRVSYHGLGAGSVFEVPADLLTRPFAGSPAPGTTVTLDDGPGVVLALIDPATALVRPEGKGAAADRAVAIASLQLAATPGEPAATPTTAAPTKPSKPSFASGDAVFVQHRDALHPATIAKLTDTMIWVAYDKDGEEAAVPPGRVRKAPPLERADNMPYGPNEPVFIEWHGTWHEGKVIKKVGPGQYKVRYEGFGAEHDELVVKDRLRPRD